jgi:acetyl/propionyl-CoA carboxylase alpha subunit
VDGAGLSDEDLEAAAAAIGFPVLVKASAGGGGRGMRVVETAAELAGSVHLARNEARSAFGDDHILLEKYFPEIHHVEIQVLGDQHGNLVHLYERECSIQRRHQKIIEESPAPMVTSAELREAIAAAAVRLCRAAGYVNAGTVEFIVDSAGDFYFLEMNTRLQVEHPVTEATSGFDLVTWQIRVAAGEPLSFTQQAIRPRGHAIECRVYAEDPANQFMPSTGKISVFQPPAGPGVRVDSGIETGSVISPYYDSMLAKIITWGADRAEALRKMSHALADTIVLGVTTNLPYLQAILADPAYQAGQATTRFLEDRFTGWQGADDGQEDDWLVAAALELLLGDGHAAYSLASGDVEDERAKDPWTLITNWRNVDI